MSELIDNRAKRIQTLKTIIRGLHEGADQQAVKAQLREVVQEASPAEVAAMEQELIAEGVPVEEIREMCDVHAAVVHDLLADRRGPRVPAGHPVDTFHRENQALRQAASRMKAAMREVTGQSADADAADALRSWRRELNDLMDVDKHYARKENLLFSCLERHEITGPSKVMWSKDDEVRDLLKATESELNRCGTAAGELAGVATRIGEPAADAVLGMVDKEEKILLPMALQTLTEDEWGEIWQQSPEYGWCLVDPREGYTPPNAEAPAATIDLPQGRAVTFPTGNLDYDQLLTIFRTLPVDLTFVDANDRVRFFSEGPDRVFARSKAIIGRKVQHCHPPDSVDVVERILEDFRSGAQDVAEFWINFRGRFVHIRYFAVRDDAGTYLGTLEVTQDATRLRQLEGERRLLQYETN
jgi:hypothetical protein